MKLPDLARVNGFAYKPGDLILSPNSPMDSAKRLLTDRYTIDASQLLYRHRGGFYCWQSSHYADVTPDYLRADINLFLELAYRQSEDKEGKPLSLSPSLSTPSARTSMKSWARSKRWPI